MEKRWGPRAHWGARAISQLIELPGHIRHHVLNARVHAGARAHDARNYAQ